LVVFVVTFDAVIAIVFVVIIVVVVVIGVNVEVVLVGSAVVTEAWNFVVVVLFLICYDLVFAPSYGQD